MNILNDKFRHRDVILCTYSKLKSINNRYAFKNIKKEDFTLPLMHEAVPSFT